MNNITIGQYIPGNSWIYKMDPRIKIILTIVLMVAIFLLPSLISMLIAVGVFFLMLLTTRIPILKMIKGLKPVLVLLLFTFILQVIYNTEGRLLVSIDFQIGMYQCFMIVGVLIIYFLTKKYLPIRFLYFCLMLIAVFAIQHFIKFDSFVWSNYKLDIYESGLEKGGFVMLRVVLMICITSLLTFSTMSTEINNGLSAVLSPLKLIKVPVGVISMMLSLTLRFIPTLLEETNKIMKAQASRGVDFSEGRLKDKIMQIISLLIPMFVISFKRAEDLANAMEARGYVIDGKRTKLDLLKLRAGDYIALVITLAILGLSIYLKVVY